MSAISSSLKKTPSHEEDAEAERNRRRGRWVPWIIALFYLSFMTALVGFVFIAYAHPPAESTAEAYEKGLAYNDILAKAEAQRQLGWTSRVDYKSGRLTFALTDRGGHPVQGAVAKAWFVHPGNPADDQSVELREAGAGVYSAQATLPSKGVWTLHVSADKDGQAYQAVATTEVE
ncbi:hypothetical protein MMA231_03908 (plasmid) [Asticcacaulis sp. MM231]|uniref:FixH family protein n=1 Tax=Asticcacaulis sp. MM231 TaxID=3157666 RepID=UPI0032D575A7